MLEATARAEARHFWFRGLRRYACALVNRPCRDRSDRHVLDCGAGTGHNLTWLAEYGWTAGIERSPTGLRFGRARGARLVRASVAALPCRDGAFDLATSFDVLYCLNDADEARALREMWRVLTPGGLVLINAAALDALRGSHSVLTHEVRRYTARRLRAKVEAAGFLVERVTYTNCCTLPLTWAVRVAQRLRGSASHASDADFDIPPAPVNAILSAMLAIEAWLISCGLSLPIGSSVMCLARKGPDRVSD
jgi:SAM-dependent methyltransferase